MSPNVKPRERFNGKSLAGIDHYECYKQLRTSYRSVAPIASYLVFG